jgi:diaminopimelate decarboxylase
MKTLPLSAEALVTLSETVQTPFHLYDEKAIRENARSFQEAFDWVPGGFKNYFAVKALPNPHIIEVLRSEGMGADCSSLAELELSAAVGLKGDEIMFTSNDTPAYEYVRARGLGAIINLDDVSHIEYLHENTGMPDLICFRFNPGPAKGGNAIIGVPEEAKYGFTREQLKEGYRKAQSLGATRFGLHTMVASNELNVDYFVETADLLFEVLVEIALELGIEFEMVNLGGGIGIPYRPDEKAVDYGKLSAGIKAAYDKHIGAAGIRKPRVLMECGRVVTGPYGYLVSRVRHRKETYKTYVGLDSCMADLMRPGMYGAYHHVTVPGKGETEMETVDVTGSLCENNDKFAIDREIPKTEPGDLVVIHDTGAHGHSMGFNYNGKLRSAEVLLRPDGSTQVIRRAESLADLFGTLDYPGLNG